MKVTLRKGKKSLIVRSVNNEFGIQLPESEGPLFLEAEFDEASPVHILIPGASGRSTPERIPITGLKMYHQKKYWVKSFRRQTKAGVVMIPSHQRRMPVRLKGKSI